MKQGINTPGQWIVALTQRGPDGRLTRLTHVRINTGTGRVERVQELAP